MSDREPIPMEAPSGNEPNPLDTPEGRAAYEARADAIHDEMPEPDIEE